MSGESRKIDSVRARHSARSVNRVMSSASAIYESLDEIGRLMVSLERMNVNNMSPIHGVADAVNDMSFSECVEHAAVRNKKKTPPLEEKNMY